ncbi:MAG TPA: carbohydrate kinase family protein [Vicinamibacterales bacterium]|nr:carbohydrate kinase family protein [Vicinamibacterales bacterium]
MPLALPPSTPATTDLVACGECSLDTLAIIDGYPAANEKRRLEWRAEAPGGQAATAALVCRRLGWRARYVGAVGDDAEAHAALESLVRYGVEVRVTVCRGVRTRTAIVISDVLTGTRTVLEARDPALRCGERFDREAVVTSRVLLVDATDVRASLAAARVARTAGVPVVLDADAVSPTLAGLLAVADVIIMPAGALCGLTGAPAVGEALRRVAGSYPAPVVVATLGAEGSIALAAGTEVRTPAHPVDVRDTTGAGDAFRAGFVAGWLGGGPEASLEDVLRYANVVGGESCRGFGAQGFLPLRADVDRLFNASPA